MILRKKNIILVVTTVIAIIVLAIITVGVLYFKTDIFKSNETMFAKYFAQNFNIVDVFRNKDTLGIQDLLNRNKYMSEMQGKVEYVENIDTSVENRNNPINDVQINIKSNIDNLNDYSYRNISIMNRENDLFGVEYLTQNENYGLRFKGIQQFVSFDILKDEEILEKLKLENIEELLSEIDINPILNFSDEEKQKLINTYMGIIQAKITKDRYYKQSNSIITIDNNEFKTNAYYVKITIEEYNNVIVDFLMQLSQDEMILSRIDLVESEIKQKYLEYELEESLREQFINIINHKIEEIKDNNIGNDEVKITVYESNGITVRTTIEKNIETIMIDLNDLLLNVNIIELGNTTKQTSFKVKRQNDNNTNDILILYEVTENNEIINKMKCNYKEGLDNNKIIIDAEIEISNEKNVGIIEISNDIELVDDFSQQVTLDTDNIKLNELDEEKLDMVLEIVSNNIEEQLNDLSSVITLEDYKKILQNSGSKTNIPSIELPEEGEVSEIQRKRFNSQFEFFVSGNLTTDNIKELINVAKSNFEDMKVLLKTGEIKDLDIEEIESSDNEKEYIESISEILIFIKSNMNNEVKKKDTIKFLDNNEENMYNVFLQYDENGLVRLVRIQIQNEE